MLEHNQLLAPVAQQVSLQTWSSLGGIACRWIAVFVEILEGDDALSCRIIVLDAWRIATRRGAVTTIESLVVRIARPIDSEVGIRLLAGNHRIAGGTIAHISICARPELESSVGWHEICRQSASVVSIARGYAKEFSGGGIVYIPAITARLFLVRHHHLQTRTVGTKIGQMDGIAMTLSCGTEQLTIMTDGSRTNTDIIKAIVVHITHGNAVHTLSETGISRSRTEHLTLGIHHFPLIAQALMKPAGRKFLSVPIHSPQEAVLVISTLEYSRRQLVHAVQISSTGIETLRTIAVTIAEESRIICCRRREVFSRTAWRIPDGVHRLARFTLEYGKEFLAAGYTTLAVKIGLGIIHRLDFGIARLGYILSLAVGGTIGRLADQLSLSVAIEIINHHLRGMVARTDVETQVDILLPQRSAIHAISADDDRRSIAILSAVTLVIRHPFQNQFIVAVAIQVAHRHVVRAVSSGSVSTLDAGRALHIEGGKHVVPGSSLTRFTSRRHDAIRIARLAIGIQIAGYIRNGRSHFLTIAVHIEGQILGIRSKRTPGNQNTLAGLDSHRCTIQLFLHLLS